MWTALVIIQPPVINDFPYVNDIAEQVFIQAFIPKATVEIPNKSVLRLDKSQLHIMRKSPLIERAAGKYGHRSVLIDAG